MMQQRYIAMLVPGACSRPWPSTKYRYTWYIIIHVDYDTHTKERATCWLPNQKLLAGVCAVLAF